MRTRLRAVVRGRVQGVGFRPRVYSIATAAGLAGFVRNMPGGVEIELEGGAEAITNCMETLQNSPPVQARIETIDTTRIEVQQDTEFDIVQSGTHGNIFPLLPPDLATCEDCCRELFDACDRRYRYPFINCTNCGPRYTIVRSLPYDRHRTSMHAFEQCARCTREYHDPADRRFDAQPNACADCGPQLQYIDAGGSPMGGDPVDRAARALNQGGIVAVKGLGGYHLCCNGLDAEAVTSLRSRKKRPHKACALMCASLDEAMQYCECNEHQRSELVSVAAPIVICARKRGCALPRHISPDTNDIGIMLPYTPLHHLLCRAAGVPLVMTSANLHNEPLIIDETQLRELLGPVADAALIHNRSIVHRCDDTVLTRTSKGTRLFFRRSRGFVPDALSLLDKGPPVLGCGAHQKVVAALSCDERVYLSPHIGDMSSYPVQAYYTQTVDEMKALFGITPSIIAHDMHPQYATTRYAHRWKDVTRCEVQHHHAHIASCMTEHHLSQRVIGVALDGTGYGDDGTIWGGEFLLTDLCDYRRVAHFAEYMMPGADAAVREPIRMALSCCAQERGMHVHALPGWLVTRFGEDQTRILLRAMQRGINSPYTSSCGRLFDAVAALCGVCDRTTYDGQAAVRLQHLCEPSRHRAYPFDIQSYDTKDILVFSPMFDALIKDIDAHENVSVIASRFHATVIAAVTAECERLRQRYAIDTVVLSGGVFQNMVILEGITRQLENSDFRVYSHELQPPNDACIGCGQVAVALAKNASQHMTRNEYVSRSTG